VSNSQLNEGLRGKRGMWFGVGVGGGWMGGGVGCGGSVGFTWGVLLWGEWVLKLVVWGGVALLFKIPQFCPTPTTSSRRHG